MPTTLGIEAQLNSSIILIQEGVEIKCIRESMDAIPRTVQENIHITPSYIEFKEASEGISCRQRITIKNIGIKPAFIRLRPPHSIAFQVKILKNGVILNPGLSVSTTVLYSFRRPSFLRATIPIEINGKTIDYRIVCKLLEEGISIEPKSIDFGIIDVGYSSGIRVITLKNEGGKSTRFSIDLGQNDLEITVNPMRGVVRPNKPLKLTVEFIGSSEGVFYSEFWIKSVPNIRVPLKANVIIPRLVVYHPNTTGDFTLIDFSLTIANSKKYDSFILRNLSSQVASYVVLGEIENEVKCIRDIDRKKYPVYNAFEIRPTQGRMDPMEGIIFEVGFTPTSKLLQWRQKLKDKSNRPANDFMAFLRIVRVHVTETKINPRSDVKRDVLVNEPAAGKSYDRKDSFAIVDDLSSSASSSTNTDCGVHDTMRLCLHGEVEEARLKFEPDIIYFGEFVINEVSERVIRISNPLKFVSIVYRFAQHIAVRCYPDTMELKPEGSTEVLLIMRGKENVYSPFNIYFDAIADSYESAKVRRKTKQKVGSYPVQCIANVILTSTKKGYKITDIHDHSRGSRKPSLSVFLPGRTKRSLVKKHPDDETMTRITQFPKSMYKDVSEIVQCKATSKDKVVSLPVNTEVLIPLSPLQIYNIHMYPSIFTFGMVVLKSHNYRQLVVQNVNDFPVMIRLTSVSANCIKFPEGNLVILPAGALVTRLVEFSAHHTGKFNGYIDYVINDNHSFELGVTADVVHKQLSLDVREAVLGMEWLKEEVYQPLDVSLRIRNKLDAKTYFRWEMPATCDFFVEPASGLIRENASLLNYVYYKPQTTRAHNAELTMKSEGSTYVSVRLSVPKYTPKVKFIEDTINVGEIPLNLPAKAIGLLANFDFVESVYEVDTSSLIHGCSVHPNHGVIMARGLVALEVNFAFSMCFDFTMNVDVSVEGCLYLQLKIMGSVSFPQLKLSPQSISLRRIRAAAYKHYLITATNVGTTMLKLNFLLQDYSEFRISSSSNRTDPDLGNEDVFMMPGASRNFHLHFAPLDLASYAFYLPILLNDMLGPALNTAPRTLVPMEYFKPFKKHYANLRQYNKEDIPPKLATISIDCTVAGHVVYFSKLEFNFHYLTNEDGEFCVENRNSPEEKRVQIEITGFNVGNCPFSICWSDGKEAVVTEDFIECTLEQGEKCVFSLAFRPTSQGKFDLDVPIFVDDELDGTMFNKLSLSGHYPARSISTNISEIFFGPVPLDVAIEKTVRLIMRDFEKRSDITAKILYPDCSCGVYRSTVLSVHFMSDNTVPDSKYSELDVKIVFKSDLSVSFRTNIQFSDDIGSTMCIVTVYATADNSLMTTHSYIRKQMDELQWIVEQDKRMSHISRFSDTFTEEDEYDPEHHSYTSKHRQASAPRISILSYIQRYSEGSITNLLETRFKLPTQDKSTYVSEMADREGSLKSEEDIRRSHLEKLESVQHSKASSVYVKRTCDQLVYPSFPTGNELDDYEMHMKHTMTAAEEWLYSSPFRFSFHPEIPTGITVSTSKFYPRRPAQLKRKPGEDRNFDWNFLDVLESLLGPSIFDYIEKPKILPDDDVERAYCLLNMYDSIIQFLLLHEAHVCHVSAQFLLDYDDYVIVIDNVKDTKKAQRLSITEWNKPEKLSSYVFESRSKQCWLDVVLQTYKCFVLASVLQMKVNKEFTFPTITSTRRSTNINQPSGDTLVDSSTPKQSEVYDKNKRNMVQWNTDNKLRYNSYSTQEIFLMAWLEFHYEQERTKEWMIDHRVILNPNESKDEAISRSIENFDGDLADSLVLIAVTAVYCPFLVEECFNNIYIGPRNFEEALHNAICVVNAWRKIRLGFVVSPLEIVYPNCVKMLMLTAYLYKTLPTYVPRTKIRFNCPLTEIATRQLNFGNSTPHNVCFLVVLFGNNNGFFKMETSKRVIRLGAYENIVLKLQFHAKKIKKTKAYLLFCGSTIGSLFGRNQTFILEGQADTLEIANDYVINSKLYEVVDKVLNVKVPYENAANYEIWMSEEQPSKPSTLKLTRWSELCLRKVPRRLFINQKSITVKEQSKQGVLSITIACIMPADRKFWIVFQSKFGDFIIQISSQWQPSVIDNLVVELNPQDNQSICTDSDNEYEKEPFLHVIVSIPSKNKQLWNCVAHMFEKTLDQKERMFWSRYLDTHIGLRLIHWLMGGQVKDSIALEFSHIFDRTVTYNVTVPKGSGILHVPKQFTINDVMTSFEKTPLDVYIVPFTGQLLETTLTLTSVNSKELRKYTVNFLRI